MFNRKNDPLGALLINASDQRSSDGILAGMYKEANLTL
jgi:hypothetical protein